MPSGSDEVQRSFQIVDGLLQWQIKCLRQAMDASVVKSDTSSRCTALMKSNTNTDISLEDRWFAHGTLLYVDWPGIVNAYLVK